MECKTHILSIAALARQLLQGEARKQAVADKNASSSTNREDFAAFQLTLTCRLAHILETPLPQNLGKLHHHKT